MMALSLLSCNDGNDEHTDKRVTYYATLELDGEDRVVVDKGSAYVEPGFSAEMKGEDVTDKVTVLSDVDTSTSGVSSVSYSITNDDGFSVVKTRTVVVLDPNDPIEGFYMTSSDAYRDYDGTLTNYGGPFEVLIINNGDGSYYFEDLMAGWYCQRAGYGADYNMYSYVSINEDVCLMQKYATGYTQKDFIQTTVGISFDNSYKTSASDYFGNPLEYDWHFLSSPLTNAQMGIT